MITALVKPSASEKIHVGLTYRFSSFGSTNTPEHCLCARPRVTHRKTGMVSAHMSSGRKTQITNKYLGVKMEIQSRRQQQRNVPTRRRHRTTWRLPGGSRWSRFNETDWDEPSVGSTGPMFQNRSAVGFHKLNTLCKQHSDQEIEHSPCSQEPPRTPPPPPSLPGVTTPQSLQ